MLGDALTDIYNLDSGLVQRVIEIQSKIDASNQHLGAISSSLGTIDSHIGSGFQLNHDDLTSFASQNHDDLTSFASQNHSDFAFLFDSVFDPVPSGLSYSQSGSFRYPIFLDPDEKILYGSFGNFILFALNNLTNDRASYAGGPCRCVLCWHHHYPHCEGVVMKTIAFMVASFLSFMPEYLRYIVIGAFAILALYVIIKLVIAVLDALPFV